MCKRTLKLYILAILVFFAASAASSLLAITYTVADPTGDWGYPSPYGMYPRGPGYVRMSFIFDNLIWKDKNGIVPALAKSWNYVPQDNAYTFNLREDVLWHDGEKFTSQDVVFTLNYINEHPWVNSDIIKKAEQKDQYAVKVYLSEPYAPFLTNVAGVLPIMPEHIWQKVINLFQLRLLYL